MKNPLAKSLIALLVLSTTAAVAQVRVALDDDPLSLRLELIDRIEAAFAAGRTDTLLHMVVIQRGLDRIRARNQSRGAGVAVENYGGNEDSDSGKWVCPEGSYLYEGACYANDGDFYVGRPTWQWTPDESTNVPGTLPEVLTDNPNTPSTPSSGNWLLDPSPACSAALIAVGDCVVEQLELCAVVPLVGDAKIACDSKTAHCELLGANSRTICSQ